LLQRLWPGTFVVEGNLANLLCEIRAVLGEDKRQPRFIRTVHGFGYAFRGPDGDETLPEIPPGAGPAPCGHRVVWGQQVMPLGSGENLLGRGRDVSVCVDAPGVSRHHARIVVTEGQAVLEDLGSKNGTYLGERRVVAPAVLGDGDLIRLGRHLLAYH